MIIVDLQQKLTVFLLQQVPTHRSLRSLYSHFKDLGFHTDDLFNGEKAIGGYGYGTAHQLDTLNRPEGKQHESCTFSSHHHPYSNNVSGGHDDDTSFVVSNDVQDVFSLAQKAILASRASLEISRAHSQGDYKNNGNREIVDNYRYRPHSFSYR